jgi:cytochrome c-type biogenesis protein
MTPLLVLPVFAAIRNASSNLYVLTAFGGGVISFVSPCVLPIVPGYLSLVTGLSVGEIRDGQPRYLARIALNTAMFVAGFTAVFVLLGLATTAAGDALFRNQDTLTRISGGLVLLMAAYLAGSQLLTTPRLFQELRFQPHLERFGPVAAPVAGAAFGLGWTPCIGPILGTVLGFAAQGRDVARAAVLLTSYSLGLGLTFLAVGLGMGKLTKALAWFRRHSRAITLASAAVLAGFGVVLLTDQLPSLTARLSDGLRDVGLGWLVDAG